MTEPKSYTLYDEDHKVKETKKARKLTKEEFDLDGIYEALSNLKTNFKDNISDVSQALSNIVGTRNTYLIVKGTNLEESFQLVIDEIDTFSGMMLQILPITDIQTRALEVHDELQEELNNQAYQELASHMKTGDYIK